MTALDRVREIEERVKVAPSLDNEHTGVPGDEPFGVIRVAAFPARVAASLEDSPAGELLSDFVEHAPADLAWLAAIARAVLEAPCEWPSDGISCNERRGYDENRWCQGCCIRRDAEASAR